MNSKNPMKIVVLSLIFQNWNYLEDIQNNNRLRLLFCFCIYVCISFRVIYYIIYTRVCVFFFVFCVILFEQFGTLFLYARDCVEGFIIGCNLAFFTTQNVITIWLSNVFTASLLFCNQFDRKAKYWFSRSVTCM